MIPSQLVLNTGQSATLTIEAYRTEVGIVEEDFVCLAVLGKSKKKEVIFTTKICGEFLMPRLDISKKEIKFRIDCGSIATYFFLKGNT